MKNKYKYLSIILFIVFAIITAIISLNSTSNKKLRKNDLSIINKYSETINLKVELAQSESERSKGLMDRKSLCRDCGMLFIYNQEAFRTFWMKNTLISLDIIFIDSEGNIINIAEQTKTNQTHEVYRSDEPVQYILEVNAGWCEDNSVKPGDTILDIDKFNNYRDEKTL